MDHGENRPPPADLFTGGGTASAATRADTSPGLPVPPSAAVTRTGEEPTALSPEPGATDPGAAGSTAAGTTATGTTAVETTAVETEAVGNDAPDTGAPDTLAIAADDPPPTLAPDPVTPDPTVADPVTPDPIAAAVSSPDPAAPDPADQSPAVQNPAAPDPVVQQPAVPDPAAGQAPAAPAADAGPPGTVLDGRYRLNAVVTRRGPITLWRGDDLVLARPVAVRVVPGGTPEREEVAGRLLHAAVASGRLVHPGAASTYDATTTETAGSVLSYVVSEWVEGTSLERLLAQGPLRPERAAAVTVAAARVIAAAHARGVHHGDLHPSDIVLTGHGAVKVTDLEIGAVLADVSGDGAGPGATVPDADATDLHALAGLLYAGLTGRWPAGDGRGLPVAPRTSDGKVCTPRQVRAGVPRELDTITLAAFGDSRAHRSPITSAIELAGDLDAVDGVVNALVNGYNGDVTPADGSQVRPAPRRPAAPRPDQTTRLPPAAYPQYPPQQPYGTNGYAPPAYPPQQYQQAYPPQYGPGYPPQYPSGPDRRRRWPWVAVVMVAVLVAAIVFGVTRTGGSSGGSTGGGGPTAAPTTLTALKIQGATAFDPSGDGHEDDSELANVYDGNVATAWHTEQYQPPGPFGGLKTGVGLVLDLGSSVGVRQVKITFATGGESFQILGTDSLPTAYNAADQVGSTQTNTGAVANFSLPGVKHRYWVLWLTNLPAVSGGFQATVDEIALSG